MKTRRRRDRRRAPRTRPQERRASRAGRAGRGLRTIVINALVFIGLLAVLESGARLLFPRDIRAVFDDPEMFVRGRPFVAPHPERGFALVPGFQGAKYRINQAGFRGSELPADWRQRALVLAVGASSTFGWLVDEGQSWPAQVQRRLGDRALVMNAAVPSYTSAQTLLYLEELIGQLRPSIVLVDALWNDALFACIDNWMPELLVRQQPARWRQVLLRRSGLYRALALKPDDAVDRPLHTNTDALAHFRNNMRRMVELCRKSNAQIAFVEPTIQTGLLPESGMRIGPRTVPRAFFAELLEAFGQELEAVSTNSGASIVRHEVGLANVLPDSLFHDPAHPTRHGHAFVAQGVAAMLEELRIFTPLEE